MLNELIVQFKDINDVYEFIKISSKQPAKMQISSGNYITDAKSILGIFSIDLSKPAKITWTGEIDSNAFKKFIQTN